MKKSLLFAIVFCSATWVIAQSSTGARSSTSAQTANTASSAAQQSANGPQSSSNSTPSTGDVKVRGCLRQGNGEYKMTDIETGTSYSLVGRGINLANYVGRDVQVFGFPTSTEGGKASPSSQGKTLGQSAVDNPMDVHSIREMGECSNSAPQ